MTSDPLVEYLTTRDAAKVLGVSPNTLKFWRHRRSDGPPFVKLGRAVRYSRAALTAWVARHPSFTHTMGAPLPTRGGAA
jgi:excisionase family DNA binding protein